MGRKGCVLPVSPCELHGGEKEKRALFPPFGLATVCTKSNCAFFPPNWKITELPGRCVKKSLGLGSQDGLQGMSLPEKDKDRLYMSPVLFKEFTPPRLSETLLDFATKVLRPQQQVWVVS